jgi:hypothetical protein
MEIVNNTHFDLNQFFKDGYVISSVDKIFCDEILRIIRKENFVKANQEKYGWKDPLVLHWEKDTQPSLFHYYWNYLSSSEYFSFFIKNFGDFSQGLPMSNKFKNGEGMAWHSDYLDGSFMTTMLYLTQDTYTITDGGYLSVGIESSEKIFTLNTILPQHGTLVCVNNLNPIFKHKVNPLVCDKERYTVMCHFGYVDPSLHSKTKPHVMFSTKAAKLAQIP